MYSKQIISKIVFVDGDKYEDSNIGRQSFATAYVGTNKAEYAHMKFTKMFPDIAGSFSYVDKYIGAKELPDLMPELGAMFVCVDNHYFRKVSDEHACSMKNFLLISGGNEMITGNVQTVQMLDGVNLCKLNIRDKHTDVASATPDEDRSGMSCEQLASLPGGGQIILANLMSATLMLGHFMAYVNSPTKRVFYESFFDGMRCEASSREVK